MNKKFSKKNNLLFILTIAVLFICANSSEIAKRDLVNNSSQSSNNYSSSYGKEYEYNYSENSNNQFNFEYGQTYYADKTPVIGLAIASTDMPYYSETIKSVIAEAQKKGANVSLMNANWNLQVQQSQISSLISQKVNAIILFPVDPGQLSASVMKIKEANIPLVNLNVKLDSIVGDLVDSFVGINTTEQGELAAELMAEALKKGGGNVAILESETESDDQASRVAEFKNKIATVSNIKITMVIKASANEIEGAMRNYLKCHPETDGIYIDDSNDIDACITAIQPSKLKNKIKLVSVDQSQFVYKYIKSGELYGVVIGSPIWEGQQAVDCAIDIINGKKTNIWYKDTLYIVTAKNLDKIKALW